VVFPTICDVTLALLTEFADKPADVLLLRLPILWGVTLALLTEFADKPLVTCAETKLSSSLSPPNMNSNVKIRIKNILFMTLIFGADNRTTRITN
jgi:hypothetical protein